MTLTNNKVVVAGAGLMGIGIAHAFASSGLATVLVDTDTQALERARLAIGKILDDGVRLGKLEGTVAQAAKARLTVQPDLTEAAAGAQLLVETVSENLAVKKAVVAQAAAVKVTKGSITS